MADIVTVDELRAAFGRTVEERFSHRLVKLRISSRITNRDTIVDTTTHVTHGTTTPQKIQSGKPSTNVKSAVVR